MGSGGEDSTGAYAVPGQRGGNHIGPHPFPRRVSGLLPSTPLIGPGHGSPAARHSPPNPHLTPRSVRADADKEDPAESLTEQAGLTSARLPPHDLLTEVAVHAIGSEAVKVHQPRASTLVEADAGSHAPTESSVSDLAPKDRRWESGCWFEGTELAA